MYRFIASLFAWDAKPNVYLVHLPFDVADEIAARAEGREGGFGSVKVKVSVGTSSWETSVFADSNAKTYVLPVKKAIRVAENLEEGSSATFELETLGLD